MFLLFLILLDIFFFLIILFILYNLLKSNLKKAEKYHKKALSYAKKEDYEKAKLFSEISSIYREKSIK